MRIAILLSALTLLLATVAQAQQSTLIIRSDAACTLTVNGMPQGQLTAGAAKPVPVGPGEQMVECAAGGAKSDQVLEVFPGAQKVVNIKLAVQVASLARFKADANRVLDTQTGLTWLASDNGKDIDWHDAGRYCAGFSPGTWSLPSMNELQQLSGEWGAVASPLFTLTSRWFWSNERVGSEKARGYVLHYGVRDSTLVYSTDLRALCVRRSS